MYDKNILSPYQRLLASPDLNAKVKWELAGRYRSYNPVELQREVHKALDALISLNRGKELEAPRSIAVAALQAV